LDTPDFATFEALFGRSLGDLEDLFAGNGEDFLFPGASITVGNFSGGGPMVSSNLTFFAQSSFSSVSSMFAARKRKPP
jgi:hypothetical protein